jgi:Acyl-CoA dehydrogenase, middle domain
VKPWTLLKRAYLPPVARGDALFSYALSEADAGSDAAGMRTRAVRDGDWWVLNGTKTWITNAGESRFYTVMAVTDPSLGTRGISAFVVEKTDPGVSWPPWTTPGSPSPPRHSASPRAPSTTRPATLSSAGSSATDRTGRRPVRIRAASAWSWPASC